jgi:hypothetical protein
MEIISGLITREEALEIIESLHSRDWSRDIKYISDLLNMSASDFENYINRHPVPHDHYASDIKLLHILHAAYRMTVKKLIFPHS